MPQSHASSPAATAPLSQKQGRMAAIGSGGGGVAVEAPTPAADEKASKTSGRPLFSKTDMSPSSALLAAEVSPDS